MKFVDALFFFKIKTCKLTTSPNWRKIKFQYNPKKAEAPLYAAFIYFFSLCYIVSFIWPDLAK